LYQYLNDVFVDLEYLENSQKLHQSLASPWQYPPFSSTGVDVGTLLNAKIDLSHIKYLLPSFLANICHIVIKIQTKAALTRKLQN